MILHFEITVISHVYLSYILTMQINECDFKSPCCEGKIMCMFELAKIGVLTRETWD